MLRILFFTIIIIPVYSQLAVLSACSSATNCNSCNLSQQCLLLICTNCIWCSNSCEPVGSCNNGTKICLTSGVNPTTNGLTTITNDSTLATNLATNLSTNLTADFTTNNTESTLNTELPVKLTATDTEKISTNEKLVKTEITSTKTVKDETSALMVEMEPWIIPVVIVASSIIYLAIVVGLLIIVMKGKRIQNNQESQRVKNSTSTPTSTTLAAESNVFEYDDGTTELDSTRNTNPFSTNGLITVSTVKSSSTHSGEYSVVPVAPIGTYIDSHYSTGGYALQAGILKNN